MTLTIIVRGAALIAALAVASACTYTGSDNPIARRVAWFSYLNGDDIRKDCAAGAPDRMRFVYNAVYVQQVRTYDVSGGPEPILKVRVIGRPDLSQFGISTPADVFGPWRGAMADVRLRDQDWALLRRVAGESGVLEPAPAGLELPSDGFYWSVVACLGGTLGFNAYLWPSERFERAQFSRLLFAWDPTGVAVNRPRPLTPFDIYGSNRPDDASYSFNMRVGENGFVGVKPWF